MLVPARFSAVARPDPDQVMTAALYQEHGPATVLTTRADYARPRRGLGQTLVRVRAAAVNPVDYKMRWHEIPKILFPLPKIPGTDFAGEVVETDFDSGFAIGERVFGMLPLLGTALGFLCGICVGRQSVSRCSAALH